MIGGCLSADGRWTQSATAEGKVTRTSIATEDPKEMRTEDYGHGGWVGDRPSYPNT